MISIRQNPYLAGIVLLSGFGLVVTSFPLANWFLTGLGAFHIVISLLMLTVPVVVIREKEVEIKNILGMVLKRVPHPGLHHLIIQGNRLLIEYDGQSTKIRNVNKSFSHQGDWKVMAEALEKARHFAAQSRKKK